MHERAENKTNCFAFLSATRLSLPRNLITKEKEKTSLQMSHSFKSPRTE